MTATSVPRLRLGFKAASLHHMDSQNLWRNKEFLANGHNKDFDLDSKDVIFEDSVALVSTYYRINVGRFCHIFPSKISSTLTVLAMQSRPHFRQKQLGSNSETTPKPWFGLKATNMNITKFVFGLGWQPHPPMATTGDVYVIDFWPRGNCCLFYPNCDRCNVCRTFLRKYERMNHNYHYRLYEGCTLYWFYLRII